VTNQPVIARNLCSLEELEYIHAKLETMLGSQGAYINAIYYCPHHPDRGYPEERVEYKIDCECRKPKPGMLLKAAKDWNIDLGRSYMIGDTERDILAGRNAGCKESVMIETNSSNALLLAIKQILNK
jgi:histidinol-phosphate phosphatase family protein